MKTMIVVLFTALVLLTGCAINIVLGSGRMATEGRPVSQFHAVSLTSVGDLRGLGNKE